MDIWLIVLWIYVLMFSIFNFVSQEHMGWAFMRLVGQFHMELLVEITFHMENCALSRNSNKIHKIYCLDVFTNIDILSFVNIDIMIINKVSVKFRHVYGYQKKTMDCRYSLDEFTGWVQTLNRLSVGTFNNVLSFSDEQLQLIQKFFCADYFLHILSA